MHELLRPMSELEVDGEYLFYFGNNKEPYFAINTLHWCDPYYEDEQELEDYWLEDHFDEDPTHFLDLKNLL